MVGTIPKTGMITLDDLAEILQMNSANLRLNLTKRDVKMLRLGRDKYIISLESLHDAIVSSL